MSRTWKAAFVASRAASKDRVSADIAYRFVSAFAS